MIHSAVLDVSPGVTLWYPEEIIRCGYVSRQVQDLIENGHILPNVHLYDAQVVAGTALISLLFKRFPGYVREVGLAAFAPPYLLEGTYHTFDQMLAFYQCELPYWDVQEEWVSHLKAGEHRLTSKGFGGPVNEVWPNLIMQSKHNTGYARGVLSEPSLSRSELNCWVPCSEIAAWLESFWLLPSTSRLVLEKNPRARARLESWQAQLTAYGAIGSKVVFVFRDCPERF
jgi:hypothetical protein